MVSSSIIVNEPDEKKCLQFYFYIVGNSKCSLNVLTKTQNGFLSDILLTREKDYGDFWHLAEITLTPKENFQVIFEGLTKNNWMGVIALDDVDIKKSSCLPSGYCNFEGSLLSCTWYNEECN